MPNRPVTLRRSNVSGLKSTPTMPNASVSSRRITISASFRSAVDLRTEDKSCMANQHDTLDHLLQAKHRTENLND
jgi:hypothetical protein